MRSVPLRSMPTPNRVGSCLWKLICILIRAHKRKFFVQESHCKFRNTLFCRAFFDYTKVYNSNLNDNKKIVWNNAKILDLITHGQLELCTLPVICCQETNMDIYSYFKENFYVGMSQILDKHIQTGKYIIANNWKKRICIHLRMDDCIHGQHSVDYDGRVSHNYFSNKINQDDIVTIDETIGPGPISKQRPSTFDLNDYKDFFKKNGARIIGRGISCYQSPIPYDRMNEIINKLSKEYPEHEIVIVASPKYGKEDNSDIKLDGKYSCIRSEDPDQDLIHLIYSDVLVCSRSTFSMVASFFHKGKKVIFPQWGYTGAAGLGSKYDKSGYELYY